MRAGLIPGRRSTRTRANEESGAVVVITVLALIAIMGMLVLTVDVGGLLLKRRAMVNASDAAALAAAQSCADTGDSFTPESRADIYASANVDGLLAENGGITEVVGCDTGRGHVTVEYSDPQNLFFAGIFGFGDHGTVTTAATAAWGPAAGGYALPIVLDSGYLQGVCKVPDGIEIGDTCAFWYNNGDSSLGAANWGFMNLEPVGRRRRRPTATTPESSRSSGLDRQRLSRHPGPQRNPSGHRAHLRLQRHRSLHVELEHAPRRDRHDEALPGQRLRRAAGQERERLAVSVHARQVRHHRVHQAADLPGLQGQRPRGHRIDRSVRHVHADDQRIHHGPDLEPRRPRTGPAAGARPARRIRWAHRRCTSPPRRAPSTRSARPGTCRRRARIGTTRPHERSRGELPRRPTSRLRTAGR